LHSSKRPTLKIPIIRLKLLLQLEGSVKYNEALSGKLEKDSYDNRHNRREVQELRKEVNEYQEETESLKERLIV